MSSAKITLFGMMNYLSSVKGVDLFAGFSELPEGIDEDTLKNTILTEGGEFEPIFSDPEIMKEQVSLFVLRHSRTFSKWAEALAIEYNPLENYDRQETWSDSGSGTTNVTSQSSGTSDGSGTNTNDVSAYDNSTGYSPHDKTTTNTSSNTSATGTGSSTASNSSRHDGRVHGNIGVTTSQQMLKSEIDISRFNIYDEITSLFIDELLLAVYIQKEGVIMFVNGYPYTDFHEMNLDWIIEEFKKVHQELVDAKLYVDNGKLYIDGKLADATYQASLAEVAKTAAQSAQALAENARDSAANSATAAAGSATAAAGSATQAEQTVANTLSQVSLLQSRVDNIIPSGTQTEGNTELIDIRVGEDGTTYQSAGDAVRRQVSGLKSALNAGIGDPYHYIYTTKKPNNLINKYRLIAGEYINTSGDVSNGNGWNRTDYIDISDYTHITMTGGIGNSAFYNASKQFISTVSSQQIGYAVPSGAVYMRCSVLDANLSTALLNGGSVQLPYDDGCVVIPLHKKEYQAGWIQFTVPVNQTIVKYNSTTSSKDDSQSYIDVECVLKLPNTYTSNGVPSKLIMLCHGAGRGVTFPNPSDNKSWIDTDEYNRMVNYFVTNGYAVFDCNGYDNTWLGVNFWGAPKGIEAWRKAYEYIVDNYNVEREFTLFGFSMGGLTACSLMMNDFPNIKCAILASPVLDLEKCWEDGQTVFMQAGYGMTTSYDPNIIGGSDPTKHLVTINDIEYCLPKMPPIKIWYGSTENGIAVNKAYAQRLVNAIQASGGFAVYREVAGAGHEICYGGNDNCNLEYYLWANRFNDNYYN